MNELMLFDFEGNKVDIIINDNGEPLFEIYSTGMALGHVKIAKGKIYPRKDRIDKNIKNAEISTVVHDGQQYITEEQLYDFMLECKTEKCKPFRRWVTHKVLPSIRKIGKYEIQMDSELPQLFNDMNQLVEDMKYKIEEQDKQIEEIKHLVGIRAKDVFDYGKIIKEHLGISKVNKDYNIIKEMFFYEVGVSKWEDLNYSRNNVKLLIDICNDYKPSIQINMFED
nr:MAG TPA: BRO family protein [Caudoviricetes sp.]